MLSSTTGADSNDSSSGKYSSKIGGRYMILFGDSFIQV